MRVLPGAPKIEKDDKPVDLELTEKKLVVEMLNTAITAILDAQKTMDDFKARNDLRIRKLNLLQKHLNKLEGIVDDSLN